MKAFWSLFTVVVLIAGVGLAAIEAVRLVTEMRSTQMSQSAALDTRIAGLKKRIALLEQRDETITLPDNLYWRAGSRSDAVLAMQRTITEIAKQNGLTLLTFGGTTPNSDAEEDAFFFNLEGEGTVTDFYQTLADIETASPPIAIESLRIRPVRRQNHGIKDVQVYFRATFWGYWRAGS